MKSLLLILALSFYQTSFTQSQYDTQSQYELDAWIDIRGNFYSGNIRVNRTQNGDRPYSYCFPGTGGMRGYIPFFEDDNRFTPLNPNNPLAIQNNFTHMISIPSLWTAYLIK